MKIVVLLLVCVMIPGMVACGGNKSENTSENSAQVTIDSTKFIMKSAKTSYKLLVSENAGSYITLAVEEFNTLFKESTGVALPVVQDAGLTFDANSKYISIGKTAYAEQNKISASTKEVDNTGYKILTKDQSIFVVSPTERGVLYGIYELLNYLIEFEYLGYENYYIQTNVSQIPFYNFDIADKPTADTRMAGDGIIINSATATNRFRYNPGRVSMPINGQLGHTSMYFLPKSKYFDESKPESYHPEWYMMGADNVTQLCYTARGNKEDLNAMVKAAFEELKVSIIDYPESTYVNFSLSDDSRWCKCSACAQDKEIYGAYSASVIKFLNKLSDEIYAWFETEEGAPHKREIYINFYAYFTLETAPVNYDAKTDTFKITSEDVRCGEYVIPQLALSNANYTQTLDSDKNKTAYNNMRSWACVSDKIMSYMYTVNYNDFNIPYDVFSALPDWYQKYYENGCIYSYALGTHTELGVPTGWSNLRIYLSSKLAWNCYEDYNAMIDYFFDKAYGNAGDIMHQVFNEYRVLSEYNENNVSGYVSSAINANRLKYTKFWPSNLLLRWQKMIEQALEKLEEIKNVNTRTYESAKLYIKAERAWVNYMIYSLYSNILEPQELATVKSTLLADIKLCGLSKIGEAGSNKALIAELSA